MIERAASAAIDAASDSPVEGRGIDAQASEAIRLARVSWLPWTRQARDVEAPDQRQRKAELAARAGASFAADAFVAPEAQIHTEALELGSRSWIAAGALVRGEVHMGADCTVNPYACLSGKVRLGDGVRIASHATIVGFNHRADDLERPIFKQGTEARGISVGDDVWIGANAVLLDGVSIGSHVIVAAGAVVSRDVPDWSVVAGVPARVVRDRRDPPRPAGRSEAGAAEVALESFATLARAEWPAVVDAARDEAPPHFISINARGERVRTARHLCDVIELAAAFDAHPPVADVAATIAWLQGVQDRATGLFPDPFQPPAEGTRQVDDTLSLYNVLAVGYALECLGAAPAHPARGFGEMSTEALIEWLETRTWASRAWRAGAAVDALGTALTFDRLYHGGERHLETLFGWLALNVDPVTGTWGKPTVDGAMLQPVNGFYRLTRGTYAQFGVPLPNAEAAIDTVLSHYRHYRGFEGRDYNACNLLDVAHPLWLCLKQTDHRREDVRKLLARELTRATERWVAGAGFAFGSGQAPSLQGTEMWLSTIYLMADVLGLSAGLSWRPKGVHRLEPVGRRAPFTTSEATV